MGTRTDNRTRLLLVISLLLNLLFLSLATVQIQNRGGLPYLVSVFSRYIGKAPIEQTQYSPLDTPRYRERVSIFSTSPATAQIVFLGDSLVERAEWAEFFPGTGAVNRGIGGDTTEGVLKRLDQLGLKPGKSGRVFLYIGINDLLSGIPRGENSGQLPGNPLPLEINAHRGDNRFRPPPGKYWTLPAISNGNQPENQHGHPAPEQRS